MDAIDERGASVMEVFEALAGDLRASGYSVTTILNVGRMFASLDKFTEAVEKTRTACREAGVDIIINLTTSGGEYEDYKRLQHLRHRRKTVTDFAFYDPHC